ncbi:MAG: helix-turn-helix domain-containing protein [Rhodococcus sp. (in: high G+C Gram-positive bacteria)]|uniref:helix-turn-helix domain-containing protein n=1 Tax=Rhodococcoides yunnanense TaxID=278209 RepID=UPI0022B1044D|nr:TetR/AcrR family transcriptional regulator [Rhodococcus yunnanensis]MCZ4274681.1 helix-turn-helix domain containing protein [Rhodococcus yunnanensis]
MDPNVPDLRERRRRETRHEISLAALDLFEQRGVAATTVDEIAKAAGVSASTFFRHFKTKEESILAVDLEIDAEIDAWLEAVAPPEVDLAGMEAIYARAAARLVEASDEIKSRVLRTRRLIVGDAHLRSAAMALDATTLCRLADVVADKLGGRESLTPARLLVEGAGMTLRIAFDEWATRVDAGEDADFGEIYANARAELRRVVR